MIDITAGSAILAVIAAFLISVLRETPKSWVSSSDRSPFLSSCWQPSRIKSSFTGDPVFFSKNLRNSITERLPSQPSQITAEEVLRQCALLLLRS